MALRLYPGVDPQVAGPVAVASEELRRKLGRPAWHVWQILLARRDAAGLTHITAGGIGRAPGFEGTGHKLVEKALARLKSAALLEPLGWRPQVVSLGTRKVRRKVYVRRVLGAPLPPEGEQVAVPRAAMLWLASATAWGGQRTSAGRPTVKTKDRIQEGATPTPAQATNPEFKRGQPPYSRGGKGNSRGGKGTNSRGGNIGIQEGAPITLTLGQGNSGLGMGFPLTVEPGASAAPLQTSDPDRGTVLVGRGTPGPMLGTPMKGVPPFPRLTFATVPSPPLLAFDADPEEWAKLCALAYTGAVESRFKGRCWTFASNRGPLRASKSFATLVAGARVLADHEIAPASWCAWSCDVWNSYSDRAPRPVKGNGWPPVNWVFGPKRIEERRGWFRSEEGSYEGGRVVFGPKQRELAHTYARMSLALGRNGVDVQTVVERYFPGDLYDRLLQEAREEIADYKTRLARQAKEGRFLW